MKDSQFSLTSRSAINLAIMSSKKSFSDIVKGCPPDIGDNWEGGFHANLRGPDFPELGRNPRQGGGGENVHGESRVIRGNEDIHGEEFIHDEEEVICEERVIRGRRVNCDEKVCEERRQGRREREGVMSRGGGVPPLLLAKSSTGANANICFVNGSLNLLRRAQEFR